MEDISLVAYWKQKFFETMCSECFYTVSDEEAKELKICPSCGRMMVDDYFGRNEEDSSCS